MPGAIQRLSAQTLLPNRPFTHPVNSAADRLALCYLAERLRETRDRPDYYTHLPAPAILFYPEADRQHHRQVLVRPLDLFAEVPLPIVGFFGQKQTGADRSPLDALDGQLMAELPERDGLAAYCTLGLASGDFANLVVFASNQARDGWRTSPRHEYAARELAPNYFASVRIYNGLLPRGLADVGALEMSVVKYFDYRSHPTWRGLRRLT